MDNQNKGLARLPFILILPSKVRFKHLVIKYTYKDWILYSRVIEKTVKLMKAQVKSASFLRIKSKAQFFSPFWMFGTKQQLYPFFVFGNTENYFFFVQDFL